MSENATPETPAPAPAPERTLPEVLRDKLASSPTPLSVADLAKGLKPPAKVKKDEFLASIPTYLEEDIRSGKAFKYPSGKAGADRYWTRDEKAAIRDAVLSAAATPKKLADLKKAAKEASKADKQFADTSVDELVSGRHLHAHPGKGELHGREKYESPNHEGKVGEAILEAATTPVKLADLIKAAQASTKADKAFVTTVANSLVESGRLHKHAGKGNPYGNTAPKPPHPLEDGKGKKDFDKLVKSARSLLESVKDVPAAELLDRLKSALALEAPAKPEPKKTEHVDAKLTESVSNLISAPVAHHKPAEPTLEPERIRDGLKSAYEELCLDPAFEDKLVEIRRLYHESARTMPGLTVEAFHRELERLQANRTVELQPINEVQRATEPHLAIQSGDRLLYFVRWR